MRIAIFGLLLLAMATLLPAIHGDMKPAETQSDSFEAFGDLSKAEGKARAQEMAEQDFAANHYRVLVAGMRRNQEAHDNYLKEKYGVTVVPIAGCVVSDGIIGAIEGYNSTMKPLLNRKFGHDIFQEADEVNRK